MWGGEAIQGIVCRSGRPSQPHLTPPYFNKRLNTEKQKMETNPYDYNRQIPWVPQQHPSNEDRKTTNSIGRNEATRPRLNPPVQQSKPEGMPKARAMALAQTLKKWIVVASLVSFSTLSGLVALHPVSAAASTSSNRTSNNTKSSTSSSQTTSSTSSSSQNDDSSNSSSFFNQPGGNNFGSSNSSQAPVSGSSVS
jgi:hypothetical protein